MERSNNMSTCLQLLEPLFPITLHQTVLFIYILCLTSLGLCVFYPVAKVSVVIDKSNERWLYQLVRWAQAAIFPKVYLPPALPVSAIAGCPMDGNWFRSGPSWSLPGTSGLAKLARAITGFTQNVRIRKLSNYCQLVGEEIGETVNAVSITARQNRVQAELWGEEKPLRGESTVRTKRGNDKTPGGPERLRN